MTLLEAVRRAGVWGKVARSGWTYRHIEVTPEWELRDIRTGYAGYIMYAAPVEDLEATDWEVTQIA